MAAASLWPPKSSTAWLWLTLIWTHIRKESTTNVTDNEISQYKAAKSSNEKKKPCIPDNMIFSTLKLALKSAYRMSSPWGVPKVWALPCTDTVTAACHELKDALCLSLWSLWEGHSGLPVHRSSLFEMERVGEARSALGCFAGAFPISLRQGL